MPAFSGWEDFSSWLDTKGLFHMELGLGRMRDGLAILGLRRPPFSTVQILGSNGKGSTAAFLDSLARSHGLRTGLFTSPHFVSPKERILVNGRQLSDAAWLDAANAIQASGAGEAGPTYFEFLTLLALRIFRSEAVDLAILEAGLGGANDATTAIPATARCYTPIALDHAAIIGPTLRDIARDKARAIAPGDVVFSAPQFPAAANELQKAASENAAQLSFVQEMREGHRLGLSGAHQKINAALALAAWQGLAPGMGIASDPAKCALGLASAFVPGRMQFIPAGPGHPSLILDGGHNPHGIQTLLRSLEAERIRPGGLVFSCLGDKDWRPGLAMLGRRLGGVPAGIVALANARAVDAREAAALLAGMGREQPKIYAGPHALGEALADMRGSGNVLLAGSLYLLAEFFALFPQALERKPQNYGV